ncbi:hypothetical protein ETH_00007215 [Eimeria tenella]|uniref:Uncharacterized protein n=1 Tax=Eimeria tenella TaxID=5802 RepID=U6L180_EIMTE|nr:hypothetical protein ETH_00007215 [Eimeria tenella]CDJ41515.1 hypothetical protein ETH_00007215 [Eimeria tenella]|eukprot:XP_013232265.1 hypothetical protein ETH_00007215 [Eimeria tenella]
MDKITPLGAPPLGRDKGGADAPMLHFTGERIRKQQSFSELSNMENEECVGFCLPGPKESQCCCIATRGGHVAKGRGNQLYSNVLSTRARQEDDEEYLFSPWSCVCFTQSTVQRRATCTKPRGALAKGRMPHRDTSTGRFQAQCLRVQAFSNELDKLQEMLYYYSCEVFSADDLHVLRHVLCAERMGPLMDEEAKLLHELLSNTGTSCLSLSERQLFISLLGKRANGSLSPEEELSLKTLLLRALANSLSSEQQLNASAALQDKFSVPLSPYVLDDLRRVLYEADDEQSRSDVQAALEEQLKPYCGLKQRIAIHRLLFLEPPWPLSPEDRHLLETLYFQPAAWWSPAQEKRFFNSIASDTVKGESNSSSEALQLLLQLLAASLTLSQRQHLSGLLEAPEVQGNATELQSTESAQWSGGLPTPLQARTMALTQRAIDGETLTAVETCDLQHGILQELSRLLPQEYVGALHCVVHLHGSAPLTRNALPILEELQCARDMWQSSGDLIICGGRKDGSGLQHMFVNCLAASLTLEQLQLLTQLLQEGIQLQETDARQSSVQQPHSGFLPAPFQATTTLSGNAGSCTVEIPGPRYREDSELISSKEGAGDETSELRADCTLLLTRDQAGLLELLLELHDIGAQGSQQDDMLANLLRRFQFSGPVSDEPHQLVHQLLLFQLSRSLSEEQVKLIEKVANASRDEVSQVNADASSDAQQLGGTTLAPGDRGSRNTCQIHNELISANQRQLLQWMLSQQINQAPGCAQRLPRSDLGASIGNEDSKSMLCNSKPWKLLIRLSGSLTRAQVQMILLLLEWTPGYSTAPESMDLENNSFSGAVDGEGPTPAHKEFTSLPVAQQRQLMHSGSSAPDDGHYRLKASLDSAKHAPKRDAAVCLSLTETAQALPAVVGDCREGEVAAVVQRGSVDSESPKEKVPQTVLTLPESAGRPLNMSVAEMSKGEKYASATGKTDIRGPQGVDASRGEDSVEGALSCAQWREAEAAINANVCLPPDGGSFPQASAAESLSAKRLMMEQLVHEAAERQIFLEDLKTWRQQYKQRAELREILNSYIVRIQTLQQGYLKRCPCLYHQQQDQREEEERKTNLKLLDSLESSIWGPAEQFPAESDSFTSSGVGLSSEVLHSVGDGDSESLCHQGSSSSGISSLASAFRDIANTHPSGALRRNRSFPRRKPSLSSRVGTSSDCCSLDRLEYSTGSMERVSSLPSLPAAKAPSHTSSIGSASPMSGEEKQKGAESLTCIRSHAKGGLRSDQHHRGISSDQLRRLRDEDMTIQQRKALMQQKALEKAQKVKVDAKVACWVACMKRSKQGKPAPVIELVDRMNLSHLNAKTLPKGKGWKTRGLLEMVEGIVSLVCKLPRGTEITSTLQPLLVLASQTRVEDIDLAVHAECEGVRRGLTRLRARGSVGPEGDGEATDSVQKNSRRTSQDILAEAATCGGDRDGTRRVTGDTVLAAARLPQRSSQQN